MKKRKYTKKQDKKFKDKDIIGSDLQNLVNQTGNPPAYPIADLNNSNNSTGRVRASRGENSENQNMVFKLQIIYDKGYDQLVAERYSNKLTLEGYTKWREFVDWVIEFEFNELFVTKFVNPMDFEEIWRKGFSRDKWEKVIRKLLSTGVKPEHNLYFRIPEFEKYVETDEKKDKGGKGVDKSPHTLKDQNYQGMKGRKSQ